MTVKIQLAYDKPEIITELFSEYTDMLIAGDSTFAHYLSLQNYEQEIEDLEYKYGMPDGRLYLAYYKDQVAGCIALKKFDAESCEMKRLYVKPEFRGLGIGGLLLEKIIADAKNIGYKKMLLDTLPFLKSAIKLYKGYGFYEIPQYLESPMSNAIYMQLDL